MLTFLLKKNCSSFIRKSEAAIIFIIKQVKQQTFNLNADDINSRTSDSSVAEFFNEASHKFIRKN